MIAGERKADLKLINRCLYKIDLIKVDGRSGMNEHQRVSFVQDAYLYCLLLMLVNITTSCIEHGSVAMAYRIIIYYFIINKHRFDQVT